MLQGSVKLVGRDFAFCVAEKRLLPEDYTVHSSVSLFLDVQAPLLQGSISHCT
jgi:hypothetical protein